MTNTVFKRNSVLNKWRFILKIGKTTTTGSMFQKYTRQQKAVLTGLSGCILQPFLNLKKGVWTVKYPYFPVSAPPVSVNNEAEHVVPSQF